MEEDKNIIKNIALLTFAECDKLVKAILGAKST